MKIALEIPFLQWSPSKWTFQAPYSKNPFPLVVKGLSLWSGQTSGTTSGPLLPHTGQEPERCWVGSHKARSSSRPGLAAHCMLGRILLSYVTSLSIPSSDSMWHNLQATSTWSYSADLTLEISNLGKALILKTITAVFQISLPPSYHLESLAWDIEIRICNAHSHTIQFYMEIHIFSHLYLYQQPVAQWVLCPLKKPFFDL